MDCWRFDMLDTSSWRPFLLSEIFEIKKGKRLKKSTFKQLTIPLGNVKIIPLRNKGVLCPFAKSIGETVR